MRAYLLDTNHLSPLVTLGHALRNRIIAHLDAGDTFAITAPALNEFLFGIRTLPRAQQNMQIWEKLQADFVYYVVDRSDAERAVDLRLQLRQQGRQLELVDSFIAIVALRNDLTLLTKDKDFLAVPTLKQENWLV